VTAIEDDIAVTVEMFIVLCRSTEISAIVSEQCGESAVLEQ